MNAELQTYLKGIVNNLPETPGCYQYLDDSGTIIYVGKAKNLKRRVSSYFNKEQQTRKPDCSSHTYATYAMWW